MINATKKGIQEARKTEKIYLKVANLTDDNQVEDVELYLESLREDLKVTLDVPLDQWIKAIAKELHNLEHNTGAWRG